MDNAARGGQGFPVDEGLSVSADSEGNAYVGGILDYQGALSKFDKNGVIEWTRQFYVGDLHFTYITSVIAEQSGNIFVVGGSPELFGSYYHPAVAFIRKYNATGELAWSREVEPRVLDVRSLYTQHESGLEVTADGLGNAYVTGYVFVPRPGQSGYYEAFVSKYDALGNHVDTTLLGNGSSDNVGLGIVADGLGNVYITGETRAILSSGSSARGDANAFIAKFRDEAVPEPASIVSAAVGLLFVAMRRCRFLAGGGAMKSASRRDAATCGRVSPRLAWKVVG